MMTANHTRTRTVILLPILLYYHYTYSHSGVSVSHVMLMLSKTCLSRSKKTRHDLDESCQFFSAYDYTRICIQYLLLDSCVCKPLLAFFSNPC